MVADVAGNQEHKLVEALGDRIARAILRKFGADAVTVTVRKPKPIAGVSSTPASASAASAAPLSAPRAPRPPEPAHPGGGHVPAMTKASAKRSWPRYTSE